MSCVGMSVGNQQTKANERLQLSAVRCVDDDDVVLLKRMGGNGEKVNESWQR